MKLTEIHSDKRGTIYSITGYLKSCPEVTMMRTNAGYARGGCIHSQSVEHLCVIEGVIEYIWGENHYHRMMKPGDTISIKPNTPHYLISLTDSVVIEWGPQIEEKQGKHKGFREIVMEINR